MSGTGIPAFTPADLAAVAARWGLDPDLVGRLGPALDRMRDAYGRVRDLATEGRAPEPPPVAVTRVPRGPDNPYGAWLYRVDDPGRHGTGPLAGRTVTVKESIAVRGVPMTLGSRLMADFVPGSDAAVVGRLRDAGAVIAGTSVCEDLCYSGSSFTSAHGPVGNPWDPRRAAGGSSSGAAVLVATGQADYGIGTDHGGSVRNPAAWCGVFGLKPTYGIVGYDGAMPTERTLDHIGVLTRAAADLVPFLEAAATPPTARDSHADGYARAVTGLRAGVLAEGFGWPDRSDPRVDGVVRESAWALERLGLTVSEVSVPLHRHGRDVHLPISIEGGLTTVFESRLQGNNHFGPYHPNFGETFGRALARSPEDIPVGGVLALVGATLLRDATHGKVMAYAQQVRARLRDQVDHALRAVDLLVLPAVPMPPHPLPADPRAAVIDTDLPFEMHDNNCVFNLTGHPALSVPCGFVDGLPVGMLLVGRPGTDARLARVAAEFEERVFRCPPPPHDLPEAQDELPVARSGR
ncbi:amidase [Sphaerisporangium siamense]|uniref:Amidase n=1 Tax=Sphaerisporangium siamense TaxID=795645 RepID=A0A7W7D519_9ACTN|nr:amidase family protein [Sphaerisporangium siamense]MBB4700302.1 amidase [Sphaerisporangium siamense]GII87717.1 amidase [Sphaerisporangium siamense]